MSCQTWLVGSCCSYGWHWGNIVFLIGWDAWLGKARPLPSENPILGYFHISPGTIFDRWGSDTIAGLIIMDRVVGKHIEGKRKRILSFLKKDVWIKYSWNQKRNQKRENN